MQSKRIGSEIHDSIPDGFFFLDRKWRFTCLKRRAVDDVDMVDPEPEELIGKVLWEEFPELRGTILETAYKKAMEFHIVQHIEMRSLATGSWYNITVHPAPEGISVSWQEITEYKKAVEVLHENEEMYRTVLENSRDGINMLDLATGKYVYMSPAQVEMTGFTAEDINTITAEETYERVHPEDRKISIEQQKMAAAGLDTLNDVIYRWKIKSGEYRWFNDRRKLIRNAQGQPSAIVGIINDITELKRATESLISSEEKYRLIAENATDVIWVLNITQNKYTYVSPSVLQMRGYTPEEVMVEKLEGSMTPESAKSVLKQIKNTIRQFKKNPDSPQMHYNQIQQYCKNGDLIWVEYSAKYRYNDKHEIEAYGASRNITERKKKEEELLYLSFHDQQTGLMNQNALRKLWNNINSEMFLNGKLSVIFMDIDNLRVINDALGHDAGDRIIVEIATKIKVCIGNGDLVYRYGGDEFIIILESDDSDYLHNLSKDILKSISTQISINKRFFYLTASIGICVGKKDETIDQTIKNADTALYISKKQKNKITAYIPAMDMTRTREAILEADMQSALGNGQFELYYQPIVDIKKGEINQAEALIRWNHPELGQISPAEFIPLAERTKLIIPITDWAIKQACSQVVEWKTMGIQEIMISVNLSLVYFENRSNQLSEFIISTINEAGIKPSDLKLEITESSLMQDPENIIKVFSTLNHLGIRLALDDFGTGYSSFGYLKDLPVHVMKIDHSLIDAIDTDAREQMILQSLIMITHGLKLEVVAEGVETRGQYEFLKKYDCDNIQGYLFSRPLTNHQFAEYYFSMKEPGMVLSDFS